MHNKYACSLHAKNPNLNVTTCHCFRIHQNLLRIHFSISVKLICYMVGKCFFLWITHTEHNLHIVLTMHIWLYSGKWNQFGPYPSQTFSNTSVMYCFKYISHMAVKLKLPLSGFEDFCPKKAELPIFLFHLYIHILSFINMLLKTVVSLWCEWYCMLLL